MLVRARAAGRHRPDLRAVVEQRRIDRFRSFAVERRALTGIGTRHRENEGGASVELYAAPGNRPTFDATFRLVGDTTNGGLSVVSFPVAGQGNSAGFASAVPPIFLKVL